ncbi:aspartyl-phosphate phosphatase Spo0E family protein [Sutcliffiella rhizosphaerae]|uniref:Aspartyl-phosphate phosphatase Spo0E family protein n=1 Tax=Sutcliffiella rhizosphaerae TaxID=2880967 RepID=A0ABM8YUJ9_9BACI|nr:aspartyl-phosphate phosphatase Spo0E family protein [Sutcliffiella rhizosphaerae]CAG9623658.1 hypothetical protein BACCIP111883_04476 [Sutcliffiella rhizosphaerae]
MKYSSKDVVLKCIESRRKILIAKGLVKGFSDPTVIELSKELDQLIFTYQK